MEIAPIGGVSAVSAVRADRPGLRAFPDLPRIFEAEYLGGEDSEEERTDSGGDEAASDPEDSDDEDLAERVVVLRQNASSEENTGSTGALRVDCFA